MKNILKYFPFLSERQIQQFRELGNLYRTWNEKINLVSRNDIEHLYVRHILHSLAIARYVQFTPGTSILDIGTGGGFPGIPLAIVFPDVNFFLVDSIAKKIKVVQDIILATGIQNARAWQARAETVKETFDFVVSRAVASLPVMLIWIERTIAIKSKNPVPNGLLALKGGELDKELNIRYPVSIKNLSDYFEEPFFETKKLVHVCI